MSFVHLHVHSQYSLLEGALRIKPMIERAKSYGMPAVAVTDTNNLFGSVDLYKQAKAAGLKPIIGCEILYAPGGRAAMAQAAQNAKGPGRAAEFKPYHHHLVLLCKNIEGYRNLCQIVTRAYTDAPPLQKGSVLKERDRYVVEPELLEKYGEGLIVLSGCLRSEIAYKIATRDEEGAREAVERLHKRFGKDFYLELQDVGIPEQDHVNEVLYAWGKKMGIESVATVDVHYLEPEDAEAQEILQCIEYGKNLDFDRPKSLVPAEHYFKPPEMMRERFERFPGAVENTLKIADQCNVEFQFTDENGKMIYHLPNFRPEGVSKEDEFDLVQYFKDTSLQGLEERFQEKSFEKKVKAPDWEEKKQEYYQRLDYELGMIEQTGFAGYFLIVADFINWAKSQGIPVGPGRGSGAGSIVAYALKITDLDPIHYSLLFERFINPERISMPDFDVDFCQDRRGEVIEYVERKYGRQNVCQIITFGKLSARAVLKDVARVLGLSFAESDFLTKLIPEVLNIKLKDAIAQEPRIKEAMAKDSKCAKIFDYALKLEGLFRNAGMHAAGVIITEDPVVTYCPLFTGSDGALVTQLDKDFSEQIGLVKFDFLGLKTLTVIDNAVKLVRKSAEEGAAEETFSIEQIDYDDAKVFELIGSADTDGVFQVESSGMKDLCFRLKPNSIEDLTAINALYRPGPLGSGMVDEFIDRKHGRKEIEYELPQLESILKDTYGVILYQEQVMQIARDLAGYSLGQADMLRRAMGKKKAEEMDRHREIFLTGAKKKELPADRAEKIYDLMAKFAEYGFNKSHSAAYAVLTYQTAYLKTYYPAEFMAALMTTEINQTEKITKYISDAKAHDIPVLAPDVNASEKQFSVERISADHAAFPESARGQKEIKAVRFGLEAIKGVGGIAVDNIIQAREGGEGEAEPEPYKNILDFMKRVSTRKVNKKVLESMTLAGCFDSIAEVNRPSLFASLQGLLEFAADEQAEKELGQTSLFDSFSEEEVKLVTPTEAIFKKEPDWPNSKKLQMEKQVVGFYVSGHPMDSWQSICDSWLGWNSQSLKEHAGQQPPAQAPDPSQPYRRPKRKEVQMGGLLVSTREVMTKKGTRMAFGEVEDLYGKVEVIFFPDAYSSCESMIREISPADPLVVTGELEAKEGEAKILVKTLERASDAHQGQAKKVILKLRPDEVSVEQLRELKTHLLGARGKCPVRIDFEGGEFKTSMELPELRVMGNAALVAKLNRIFGRSVVRLQ